MRYFTSNKVIAALQGAGCGIGGLALLAADLPALFTISLRAIQQIGACYGLAVRNPSLTPVIMNILNTGASFDTALRKRAFLDTGLALPRLADSEAARRVIERIQSGTLEGIVRGNIHRIPGEMARNIAEKKLLQFIPLVSAGISAGFDYWFMSNTLQSSYMIFRKLHLEMKYPAIDLERERTETESPVVIPRRRPDWLPADITRILRVKSRSIPRKQSISLHNSRDNS